MNYLYRGKFKSAKTVFSEIQARTVRQLPIPCVEFSSQANLITLADFILAAKRRDPEADTTEWEREIDQLVNKLYGLTPEEIATVEGKSS